jgi:prepilin-type N-terminal cleavage/methylation domain-containing protein
MNRKGFTLFEILVSLLLISLAALGMINLFVLGKKYVAHSQARMSGGEIGKFFLEPLRMQVRQDTWGTGVGANCLSSDGTSNCGFNDQTVNNIAYAPLYARDAVAGTGSGNPNDGTQMRRVTLQLQWYEPNP